MIPWGVFLVHTCNSCFLPCECLEGEENPTFCHHDCLTVRLGEVPAYDFGSAFYLSGGEVAYWGDVSSYHYWLWRLVHYLRKYPACDCYSRLLIQRKALYKLSEEDYGYVFNYHYRYFGQELGIIGDTQEYIQRVPPFRDSFDLYDVELEKWRHFEGDMFPFPVPEYTDRGGRSETLWAGLHSWELWYYLSSEPYYMPPVSFVARVPGLPVWPGGSVVPLGGGLGAIAGSLLLQGGLAVGSAVSAGSTVKRRKLEGE